jgi:tetratricopeptide (TPR) repeat protein
MKSLIIKGAIALFIIGFFQVDVLGQTGRFGATPEDSIRALRNLAMFSDNYNREDYESAMPYWRVLFDEFPRSTANIYIRGDRMMRHFIENADSEEERAAYLDTAMMMFDQRIEHFGDREINLARKGVFYFQYNNRVDEAGPGYEALAEAIRLSENNPSATMIPQAILTYMNVTVGKFRAGLVDNEYVVEKYAYLTGILEDALQRSHDEQLATITGHVESLFTDSGAADCDAIIRIFGERVEESPEDPELLQSVHDLLSGAGCTDTELYLSVTENIHRLDPSAQSAINLSAMHRSLNNDDQVVRYLREAIELQDNPEERGAYYLELALITSRTGNDKQQSRQYALQALEDNPGLGQAHLHIGSLYASEQNCFTGDEDEAFKKRTIYWVAVDRFNQARQADPGLTAQANRLIETYSVYFPDTESIFFHGYTEGDSYRVGCWINETTRIRARRQ